MDTNQAALDKLTTLLIRRNTRDINNIVVLTGAGVSAESGINTFRAADGLWENHHIEDVATSEGFIKDPQQVQRFYNERRQQLLNGIKPNAAHNSLATFEKEFSGHFTLVTQNIDNLHERAGSQKVLHMHGELLRIRCSITGKLFECRHDISIEEHCDCCEMSGTLRPHVVWFGEIPLHLEDIYQALEECDIFIAIGTSGNVYPAAGFFQVAQQAGALSVELNLDPSSNAKDFDLGLYGPATKILPLFFDHLKSFSK